MKYFLYAAFLTMLISCSHKSSNEEVAKYEAQFQEDEFNLQGAYHWDFQLMGSTQESMHTLYADSIGYVMKGKVYSTDYTMKKLSFDRRENKWIGRDGDGIVYVMFFKDPTDSTLTIYKHKCKTNGLQEAIAFELPPPDATEDHGWNVYSLGKVDARDVLALQGHFTSGEYSVKLADHQVSLGDQSFTKLGYHKGERRWVGQQDSTYLQVFFQSLKEDEELFLSVVEHKDLEKAYRIKYNEVSFSKYEKQKE
ncbi:MAG: hypothetical protein AAFP19_14885 [Bacteroidota bacterium]